MIIQGSTLLTHVSNEGANWKIVEGMSVHLKLSMIYISGKRAFNCVVSPFDPSRSWVAAAAWPVGTRDVIPTHMSE